MSGGTLLECKRTLRKLKPAKISCYTTHAVFPNQSWKKFCKEEDEDPFDVFYVTDSVGDSAHALEGRDPFQVLTLASSIAQNIRLYL